MTLQDTARAALGAIMDQHADAVVTVTSNGVSADGIKSTVDTDASLTDYGEQGETSGLVRIKANDLTEPARGASITIDGDTVFVLRTRLDAVGATLAIEYSKQRPVEGI